jgi:hypothetical protein
MGLCPTKVMKKRLGPATTFYKAVALSFVIPKAKPRDLQFRGLLVEMFFDRTWRSGKICGFPKPES